MNAGAGWCRRIPLDSVPTDTDEACAEWLHGHFREKVIVQFLTYYISMIPVVVVITRKALGEHRPPPSILI